MKHSYSGIKTYEACPAAFKFSRIDRLPSPSGPAAERGSMLHGQIEKVLLGELPFLHKDIAHLLPQLNELKAEGAIPEHEFAINRNWEPVKFKADDVMLRGIIDVWVPRPPRAIISDWKSGKKRDYSDQVEVYATVQFAVEPTIDEIQPVIDFIDLKKSVTYPIVKRDNFPEMKVKLQGRIDAIESDKIFAPNPSQGCRWCAYAKSAGGPCQW
jgi:hypothetical protein